MAPRPSASKQKPYTLSFLVLSLILILMTHTLNFRPKPVQNHVSGDPPNGTLRSVVTNPSWYNFLRHTVNKKRLKLGLINIGEDEKGVCGLWDDIINVNFERVSNDKKWEDFFPEWVDEDERWNQMSCPEIPMPRFEDYGKVDVVVARVPEGVRDVFRLQVNLVVANMLVRSSGWEGGEGNRTAYVVFFGSSGPMWELFRCDDMLWHEGEYRIYRPDIRRLRDKVVMPVGSCQIAPTFSRNSGQYFGSFPKTAAHLRREAYVTVLHSSEIYVCGAIALAQSIIQTNSTKDLVLLADDSISKKSLTGLKAAGWKIKRFERIRSPHAKVGAYNEYNYSKLRIWQLVEYNKVIFIDSDLIVLRNIDKFFSFPQMTAVGNDKYMFNSGVMLVEPSYCMFNALMEKRFTLASYNGGDQGFLNEAFTWWHRWHSKLNHLKIFQGEDNDQRHDIPEDLDTIHYLGLKPWMCYKDYDCNWDVSHYHPFASDSAHRKWWQVYDAMPRKLKPYCGLTKRMEARITKWRGIAANASFPDGHWKIKVTDKRSHHSVKL